WRCPPITRAGSGATMPRSTTAALVGIAPSWMATTGSSTIWALRSAARRADSMAALPVCRFCAARLEDTFVDLGMSPLCESYIRPDRLSEPEPFYPLHAFICRQCLLVQLDAVVPPEAIFSDYAYFSSYSDSWVAHARAYADAVIARFDL